MIETLIADEDLRPPAGHPLRFGGRWRLVGAGLSNVWRYGDLVLPAASGRLLLRGPNGTGKTTALEALWPFLLDLDNNKLRADRARTTSLTSLMREGHTEKKRVGYVWLTFAGPDDEGVHSYGCRLVFSNGSTPSVATEPFTIPGEPVTDLALKGPGGSAITTSEAFEEAVVNVGGTVFHDEVQYRTALGNHVFGTGPADLLALANRIRRVRNPSLLAETSAEQAAEALREALPGVSPDVIEETGEALAATEETRAAFRRDEEAAGLLDGFAEVWTGHAHDVVGRLAGEAEACRGALAEARRRQRDEQQRHAAAVARLEAAEAAEHDAQTTLTGCRAKVAAIESSPEYGALGRLDDLRRAADASDAADAARTDVLARQVSSVRDQVDHLREAVRDLAEEVEEVVRDATTDPNATSVSIALRSRPAATVRVGDRTFDPGPGVAVSASLEDLAGAARQWGELAEGHDRTAATAELMLNDHRRVATAEMEADQAGAAAGQADQQADQAASVRDGRAAEADRAAAAAAAEILGWAGTATDLTADDDNAALTGDHVAEARDHGPAALIDAAEAWRDGAVQRAARIAAGLDTAADGHEGQARAFDGEAADVGARAAELRAGRVLLPPRPDWAGEADGREFAGALRWRGAGSDEVHARVESALAASGLLGATLTELGISTDAWRVSTAPPVLRHNLTELVDVEPDHPQAELARMVLQRIALAPSADPGDDGAPGTVIGRDGTFRLGTVLGRSPGVDDPAAVPVPSHIGAARRRAAALAEAERLDGVAVALDGQAAAARQDAVAERERAADVRRRADAFPGLRTLRERERDRATAAATAAQLGQAAVRAADAARLARRAARELREQWDGRVQALGLPPDVGRLRDARDAAISTATLLRSATRRLQTHHSRLLRLLERIVGNGAARDALPPLVAVARQVHEEALVQRRQYEELEAERGRDATDASRRLAVARSEVQDAERAVHEVREAHGSASTAEVESRKDAERATERVDEARPAAESTLRRLAALVAVPDVAATVLGPAAPQPGDALVDQLLEAVRHRPTAGRKSVADAYETVRAELRGVWAVDRADGFGDVLDTYLCTYDGVAHPPRAAATVATAIAERARVRLQKADDTALRDFIVGRLPKAIGLADTELRDWVRAVNEKMASASASSGVGVRVRVSLRDDLSPAQRTVHRLASGKSISVRNAEEDRELARALQALLDGSDADTETGRVQQAVDLRQWYRVDYWVHRPGQEPTRWTTRSTGLSGGERRLVILAPMLASIAALYDNLPGNALRLAALDEVPAEVDDQGREGLARYIAELDLDVICTSYLWDGAPGAWDGIDAYDLEAVGGVVVGFPMLLRGTDLLPDDPAAGL